MVINIEHIVSALGLLGVGAILKSILDVFLEKRKLSDKTEHEFKQLRYKAIVLLMYSLLDFEKSRSSLLQHGRDFKNVEGLFEELKAEWVNMTLYASDNVIISMKAFLQNPTLDNYNIVTLAMRRIYILRKPSLLPTI